MPFGAAPHECYGMYEPFYSHLDQYAEWTGKDPIAGAKRYLAEFYYEPSDWAQYLSKLGMAEILDASNRGRSVYND